MMPAPRQNPYEAMRRRVQQQGAAAQEQGQDQIRRQFAANGMAGSGANIKIQQKVADDGQRATADAMSQVDAQEAQQQTQLDEAQKNRAFTTSEREAGQKFSQGMFDQDMAFKQKVESNADYWRGIDAAQSEAANAMNFTLGMGNLDWHPNDANRLIESSRKQFTQFSQTGNNPNLAAIRRRLG